MVYVQAPSDIRCAYVFLVMKGDAYIAGACAAAYSIRASGSVLDIVCMVTEDVSNAGVERLKILFTKVITIQYIQFPVIKLKTIKQQEIYQRWMDVSFTKWQCLSLIEYDKILFVDADKIILSNIDHLFHLQAPAGTFASPWAEPWIPNGIYNPYQSLRHGDLVKYNMIESGFKQHSFVVLGTMVLLQPNWDDYLSYKRMLSEYVETEGEFGFRTCHSGMDEQSITYFYHNIKKIPWTWIHQMYNYIPWHRNWLANEEKPVRQQLIIQPLHDNRSSNE